MEPCLHQRRSSVIRFSTAWMGQKDAVLESTTQKAGAGLRQEPFHSVAAAPLVSSPISMRRRMTIRSDCLSPELRALMLLDAKSNSAMFVSVAPWVWESMERLSRPRQFVVSPFERGTSTFRGPGIIEMGCSFIGSSRIHHLAIQA